MKTAPRAEARGIVVHVVRLVIASIGLLMIIATLPNAESVTVVPDMTEQSVAGGNTHASFGPKNNAVTTSTDRGPGSMDQAFAAYGSVASERQPGLLAPSFNESRRRHAFGSLAGVSARRNNSQGSIKHLSNETFPNGPVPRNATTSRGVESRHLGALEGGRTRRQLSEQPAAPRRGGGRGDSGGGGGAGPRQGRTRRQLSEESAAAPRGSGEGGGGVKARRGGGHRRVLLLGLPGSGASLMAYVLGQLPKSVVIGRLRDVDGAASSLTAVVAAAARAQRESSDAVNGTESPAFASLGHNRSISSSSHNASSGSAQDDLELSQRQQQQRQQRQQQQHQRRRQLALCPTAADLSDVPPEATVVLRASVGGALSYPELVRCFRPHATALFLRHPPTNYATLMRRATAAAAAAASSGARAGAAADGSDVFATAGGAPRSREDAEDEDRKPQMTQQGRGGSAGRPAALASLPLAAPTASLPEPLPRNLDGSMRLLERLWARRDALFNATLHLEELVPSPRPILRSKLQKLGFSSVEVRHMLALELPVKAIERGTKKRCRWCAEHAFSDTRQAMEQTAAVQASAETTTTSSSSSSSFSSLNSEKDSRWVGGGGGAGGDVAGADGKWEVGRIYGDWYRPIELLNLSFPEHGNPPPLTRSSSDFDRTPSTPLFPRPVLADAHRVRVLQVCPRVTASYNLLFPDVVEAAAAATAAAAAAATAAPPQNPTMSPETTASASASLASSSSPSFLLPSSVVAEGAAPAAGAELQRRSHDGDGATQEEDSEKAEEASGSEAVVFPRHHASSVEDGEEDGSGSSLSSSSSTSSTPSTTAAAAAMEFEATCAELMLLVQQRASVDRFIVFTFADNRWLDMLLNWMVSLHEVGMRHYLVLSVEAELHNWLLDKGAPSFYYTVRELSYGSRETFRSRLWYHRWKLMGEVLTRGFHVLHSDADALWLGNPLPLLRKAPASIVGGRGANKEDWLVCMGWVFFRSTPLVIQLFPAFLKRIRALGDDQRALNVLIRSALWVKWNKNPFSGGGFDQVYVGTAQHPNFKPKPKRSVVGGSAPSSSPSSAQQQLRFAPLDPSQSFQVLLLPNNAVRRFFCSERSKDSTLFVLHCRDVQVSASSYPSSSVSADLGTHRMTQGETASGKSAGVKFLGLWRLNSDWRATRFPLLATSAPAPGGGAVGVVVRGGAALAANSSGSAVVATGTGRGNKMPSPQDLGLLTERVKAAIASAVPNSTVGMPFPENFKQTSGVASSQWESEAKSSSSSGSSSRGGGRNSGGLDIWSLSPWMALRQSTRSHHLPEFGELSGLAPVSSETSATGQQLQQVRQLVGAWAVDLAAQAAWRAEEIDAEFHRWLMAISDSSSNSTLGTATGTTAATAKN